MDAKHFLCSLSALLCFLTSALPTRADDWPAFRHSSSRNAVTLESLPEGLPYVRWEHQPAQAPSPAWYGPAKWDAYANLAGLHSMRDYDQVYHAIAADGAIYYASSAEDCVRKLDPKTGEVEWTFFTNGPVRVPPCWVDGKLYFGSDDGYAYCIDGTDGSELWRFGARADGRRVLNDGKLIPLWPVRTGVTVYEGTAYFAASLLPWEPSLVCAVNATTGEEIYRQQVADSTMESSLVVSPRFVIAPQGRVPPLIFARQTGEPLGQLEGGGGSFVVLIDDYTTMHGPGNKEGWIEESNLKSKEKIATHKQARSVVHVDDVSYFISHQSLFAINYDTKEKLWKADFQDPLSLIATSNALVVGGVNRVAAFDAATGKLLWEAAIEGRIKGLAFADQCLFASSDTGGVSCLTFGGDVNKDHVVVASPPPAPRKWHLTDDPDSFQVAAGPVARFLSDHEVEIVWETAEPVPTTLTWIDGDNRRTATSSSDLGTDHCIVIDNLQRNRMYHFQIPVETDTGTRTTPSFECDTFFNYHAAALPEKSSSAHPRRKEKIDRIVQSSRSQSGVCLVLGASADGWLAEGIARDSNLRLIVVDPDLQRVNKVRNHLAGRGLYGGRISVLHVTDVTAITSHIGTLVTSGAACDGREIPYGPDQISRLLAPNGVSIVPTQESDEWQIFEGKPFSGSSDWTHTYALPDNTAFAGETLDHAKTVDDFAIQWLGRPGPRYQSDRSGRKPSPLAADGRLFLQGLDRIVALDAYTGTIHWSLETPYFHRFNMPRDCGNWCADGSTIYAAIRDRCWKLDAATGKVLSCWLADDEGLPSSDAGYQWGYIAREDDLLLGTVVRGNAPWEEYWGGEGWYDKTDGSHVLQVASDRLFALDAKSGNEVWSYDGLVINSSITVSEGAIYFVECKNASLIAADSRRIGGEQLWTDAQLVCVDLATGSERWTRSLDDITPGLVAFWVACRDDKLITVSSADVKFETNAFSTADGEKLWTGHATWGKGKADHGTHLSRPAIVDDRVIVRPAVFDLNSGELRSEQMPVSGCGTYACTTDALFFRAWSGQEFAVWSPESNEYTRWSRLRPDCWLSSIPAAGLLLSPEGGGGCSCGKWLETSLAFIPKSRLQATTPSTATSNLIKNDRN